jgi:hypothetical protein
MAAIFTPKDILAIKNKYPNDALAVADITKVKVFKNDKTGQQAIYYVPFNFKNLKGNYQQLQIKFNSQVLSGNAKPQFGVTEDQAKNINISYASLDEKKFDGTEYNPEKIEELVKANKEFIDALDIIAEEYNKAAVQLINSKPKEIKMAKGMEISSFRQTHRNQIDGDSADDVDDSGKVKLPHPIYRFRINAVDDKRLGWKNSSNDFMPCVFDLKKKSKLKSSDSKAPIKDIPAKVMSKGKLIDLTIQNAKHFITYMSLTGGLINFETVCISKKYVSLRCTIKSLHVWHHKPLKQNPFEDSEFDEMFKLAGTLSIDKEDVSIDEAVRDEAKGATGLEGKGRDIRDNKLAPNKLGRDFKDKKKYKADLDDDEDADNDGDDGHPIEEPIIMSESEHAASDNEVVDAPVPKKKGGKRSK